MSPDTHQTRSPRKTATFDVDLPVDGPLTRDAFFGDRAIHGLRPCKRLAVGMARAGGVWGDVHFQESIAVLHAAWSSGCLLVDTAPAYADGKADELLGRALKEWHGERPVVLAKIEGYPEFAPPGYAADWTASATKQLETTRRHLGDAAIDGLAMHDAEQAPREFQEPCFAFMQEQKHRGAIKAIGMGGGRPTIQTRWLRTGRCDYTIVFKQISAVTLQGLTDTAPLARRHGTTLIAASPVMMGLLGSKHEEYLRERPDHITEACVERSRKVNALARGAGISLPRLALRFVLSVPSVDFVLAGPCTIAEWGDARAAYEEGPLSSDLYAAVWKIAQEGTEPLIGG